MVVVDPLFDHRVDLDGDETHLDGSSDALQHVLDRKSNIVDAMKDNVIDRIETDGDPVQACRCQSPGLLAQ